VERGAWSVERGASNVKLLSYMSCIVTWLQRLVARVAHVTHVTHVTDVTV